MASVSALVGGALWAAAAVKVAGYTWQAFADTYDQFPAPGSQTAVPVNLTTIGGAAGRDVTSTVEKIPVVGDIVKATNVVGQGGAPWYIPPAEMNYLMRLPAPPAQIIANLKRGARTGNAANAMNQLQQWAQTTGRKQGWRVPRDVDAFARYLGVAVYSDFQN